MSRRLNIANIVTVSLTTVSLAAISAVGCGGSDDNSNAACKTFTAYTATTATPLSFATDIYPILKDTSVATGGCSTTVICHGQPAQALDPGNSKYLTFLFGASAMEDAAMAKAQLLMPSVNAPSMPRVTPGSVGQSFLAYKLAKDRTGLACAMSSCQSGASVGVSQPCGDLMPSVSQASFSDANRTKILDWIAQGASD
jgi:hypothetical protein